MASIPLPDGKKLTENELIVLRLLLQGHTAGEVAEARGLTRWTIYDHMHRVHGKLGTHNVLQVRVRLKAMGLLDSVMEET